MKDGGEGEMNSISMVSNLQQMDSELDALDGAGGGGGRVEGKGGVEVDMSAPYYLDKFTLFETPTNYYLVGRDEKRLRYRVLKIGRSKPSELVIYEDPTIYSYPQCRLLLEDINEGNKLTGGRKFVTHCYGIVGFIKLMGPYYLLLITERKEIGRICGHAIYAISEYRMIPIPHHIVGSCMNKSERENRYKKLLSFVDIRKDFFFSNTYPIMHSLQKNLCQKGSGQSSDGEVFIWNDYLTRQIRNHLQSTLWTVALVHGFFKQVELSSGGKKFLLTLIGRRSCQFAGTRYLKRGVNEDGQAANDVEIEQIVGQECLGDQPYKITSAVQNRASIPLRWSQKPSLWNLKPDIIISESNNSYEATYLHLLNLRRRYGDPIIPLSLVKTCKNNHPEYRLHAEFQNAVAYVNMRLPETKRLNLLAVDLDAEFRNEKADTLAVVKEVIESALQQVGFFSCQISQPTFKASLDFSYFRINPHCAHSRDCRCSDTDNISMKQEGVLRTNCLDSLDRTNAAQYVYGLVALGHQLNTLKMAGTPEHVVSDTLASELMSIYEALGDALAQQYGGSAAHCKIFSQTRGQPKAATIFQELIKSVKRHLNNSFMDFDKQQAIDLFLGQSQPGGGESPQLYSRSRLRLKRSKSDCGFFNEHSPTRQQKSKISCTKSDLSILRHSPRVSSRRLLTDFEKHWYGGCEKYVDEVGSLSWTGTSEGSGYDESDDRWIVVDSPASSV